MVNNRISSLSVRYWLTLLCLVLANSIQAADSSTEGFSARSTIGQRLLQTQTEMQRHVDDSDSQTYVLLQHLESAIYHHQAAVDFLAAKENERDRQVEKKLAWSGFDQSGPYTVLFSDELNLRRILHLDKQRSANTRLRIISRTLRDSTDQLPAFQQKEREFSEKAENAANEESRQLVLLSMQHNDIIARTAVEKVAYLELRQRGVQAEIATFKAGQELAELQLASISGLVTFDQSDFEDILNRINNERSQALSVLNEPGTDVLGEDARIAWLAEFLDTEEIFWKTRYELLTEPSRANRKKALIIFRDMAQMIDIWAQAGKTLADEQLLQLTNEADNQALENKFQKVAILEKRLTFVTAELEQTSGFGASVLNSISEAAMGIWGVELYVVEDTSTFDGKKVTSYRAITYGKLIQLAIILTAGWFALKFLSSRVRRMASTRFNRDHASASSFGRWTFGLGLGLLIIYALKTVNIPFTAFAFLGGTLAIGIGFGAQTLVKNFISGLILMLERPFKVGDYIEVDTVVGQIQRIGMRASVIEHFDGIETLVPNGVLVDHRVDNWTFGKTAIRGSVTIGVAYDSSTRDVTRTLLAAGVEHGQVLDRPEPEVRFKDFGNDAMVFRLLYWVDAAKSQRERIDSDLRFMIHKGLKEAGVAIAYPQRDIHFDPSQPLQVEVTSSPETKEPETDKG